MPPAFRRGRARGEVEIDEAGRGIAREHLRPVEGEGARAQEERLRLVELVVRHVVRVGPDPELGIVVELVVRHHEVVQVVGAGGVGRLGDREELVVVGVGDRAKLAQEPAVRQGVVGDDGVAVVDRRAGPAQEGPDAGQLAGRSERAAALVEHPPGQVDHLDVVVGSDVAHGVGGDHAAAEKRRVVVAVEPVEARAGAREAARLRRLRLPSRLQGRVGSGGCAPGLPAERHHGPRFGGLVHLLRRERLVRRQIPERERPHEARGQAEPRHEGGARSALRAQRALRGEEYEDDRRHGLGDRKHPDAGHGPPFRRRALKKHQPLGRPRRDCLDRHGLSTCEALNLA